MKVLELNGPANCLILLELYKDSLPEEFKEKMNKELLKTVKYMKQAVVEKVPMWHELEIKGDEKDA